MRSHPDEQKQIELSQEELETKTTQLLALIYQHSPTLQKNSLTKIKATISTYGSFAKAIIESELIKDNLNILTSKEVTQLQMKIGDSEDEIRVSKILDKLIEVYSDPHVTVVSGWQRRNSIPEDTLENIVTAYNLFLDMLSQEKLLNGEAKSQYITTGETESSTSADKDIIKEQLKDLLEPLSKQYEENTEKTQEQRIIILLSHIVNRNPNRPLIDILTACNQTLARYIDEKANRENKLLMDQAPNTRKWGVDEYNRAAGVTLGLSNQGIINDPIEGSYNPQVNQEKDFERSLILIAIGELIAKLANIRIINSQQQQTIMNNFQSYSLDNITRNLDALFQRLFLEHQNNKNLQPYVLAITNAFLNPELATTEAKLQACIEAVTEYEKANLNAQKKPVGKGKEKEGDTSSDEENEEDEEIIGANLGTQIPQKKDDGADILTEQLILETAVIQIVAELARGRRIKSESLTSRRKPVNRQLFLAVSDNENQANEIATLKAPFNSEAELRQYLKAAKANGRLKETDYDNVINILNNTSVAIAERKKSILKHLGFTSAQILGITGQESEDEDEEEKEETTPSSMTTEGTSEGSSKNPDQQFQPLNPARTPYGVFPQTPNQREANPKPPTNTEHHTLSPSGS